jgi:hypothetical protein
MRYRRIGGIADDGNPRRGWKPALSTAGLIPPPTKDNRGRRQYVTQPQDRHQ